VLYGTAKSSTNGVFIIGSCARRYLNPNAGQSVNRAADIITQHPVALQPTEKNSTIIFPAQFMTTVQEAIAMLNKDSASDEKD